MKKILLLAITFLTITALFAQTEEKMNTLFDSDTTKHGSYGGPEIKFSKINGQWGILLGGKGGWIVNSTVSIGGAGYLLMTNHVVSDYPPVGEQHGFKDYLRIAYGGLFLEYINSSNEVFHFTINSLVGAGGAAYTAGFSNTHGGDWFYDGSAFFIFEPGATIDINFTKSFRISLGASYRIVLGLELPYTVTNKDLEGASINLGFKFGKF